MKARYLVVGILWATSLLGVGLWAQENSGRGALDMTIRPGRIGPIMSGQDIGFQVVANADTRAGVVAGRLMVRINGEWLVAAVQDVSIR